MPKSSEAPHTSSPIVRSGVHAMRIIRTSVPSMVQAVAAHSALRSTLLGLLVLGLLSLIVMSLSHFQLWMTGAGFFLVAMSILSAVQEFKLPKTARFLDENIDRCRADRVTLPHLAPVAGSASTTKQQGLSASDATSSMTLNIAPPSTRNLTTATTIPVPSSVQETISRRGSEDSIGALESAVNPVSVEGTFTSCSNVGNKLDVLHCGTVIDIQGTQGFLIPHDLCVDATRAVKPTSDDAVRQTRPTNPHKMPLIVPFSLNEEETAGSCREIVVGKTVEFAYAEAVANSKSPATMRALNVTPVPTDEGLVKSRSALQSCKQAREVSFARAMEELTVISPRNVPVEHHVDLIKYAEKLDNHDAPLDQFI